MSFVIKGEEIEFLTHAIVKLTGIYFHVSLLGSASESERQVLLVNSFVYTTFFQHYDIIDFKYSASTAKYCLSMKLKEADKPREIGLELPATFEYDVRGDNRNELLKDWIQNYLFKSSCLTEESILSIFTRLVEYGETRRL